MKRISLSAIIFLVFTMVLAGCQSGAGLNQPADKSPPSSQTGSGKTGSDAGGGAGTGGDKAAPAAAAKADDTPLPSKDISGEITVWAFTDKAFQEVGAAFMKEYPKIKVNTVILPFGDLHDKLQTTLAAGTGAPDVAEVEQGQFPRYTTGNVLQDLLQSPYNAGRFETDTSKYNWERWKSVDSKQLLGMPWDITPGVTYYRADIMDELGLPSDPDQLGDYIQDPDNFFNLAQTLAANGKYTMEWRDSLIHYYGDQFGYFDSNLNWVRNGDGYVKFLDFAKKANQLKIAPHDGYLSDKGKQRVKKGEQVSVMLGSWGERDIASNFPELAGKWRATKLPLGLNVGMGGSSFIMPAQSKNKDAAWAYIQWTTRSEAAWKIWTKSQYSIEPSWKSITGLDWYKNHTNDYLGGQKDFAFYDSLTDAIPVKRNTRLDGKAWGIWLEGVLKALDKNIDSKTELQEIQDNIQKKMAPDITQLKKDMGLIQ
jgi:multiple sugar transport system substrate-binding protein